MEKKDIDLSRILVLTVNPRVDYTKIAVYRLEKTIFLKMIRHTDEELSRFNSVIEQEQFRADMVMEALKDNDIDFNNILMVMGRGGLIHPVKSGIYQVNERMKKDLDTFNEQVEDVVNLGGLIADNLARRFPNAKAYIADPVVVDEFDELARVAGHPLFERKSIFHALNQKYVARMYAKSIGKKYDEMNLIVVNLGGGITVGMHHHGRVIDATYGYDGDGPFSVIGSGSLPAGDVIRFAFSGKYTLEEMLEMVRGKGGMVAYLNTNSGYEAEKRVEKGDEKARFIFEAMAYQVAKEVGAMCMTVTDPIDAILVTGPMANSRTLMKYLMERLPKVSEVHVYPGDDELEGLAYYAYLYLKGEIKLQEYNPA